MIKLVHKMIVAVDPVDPRLGVAGSVRRRLLLELDETEGILDQILEVLLLLGDLVRLDAPRPVVAPVTIQADVVETDDIEVRGAAGGQQL